MSPRKKENQLETADGAKEKAEKEKNRVMGGRGAQGERSQAGTENEGHTGRGVKRKETHARRIERDRETQSETESRNQQECCEALRREEPVKQTEPEAGGECVHEAVCVCDGWRCRRVCVCM